MQRCQRASGRKSAALSISPRQASEMINCTPLRPRSTRCPKKPPPEPPRVFLPPPDRNARQIHLDQRFLDRVLAAAIALDDRRLKGLAPQLRTLEIDFAGAGLQ